MKPSPGYLAGVMVPMWLAKRMEVSPEAKLFYSAIACGINPSRVVKMEDMPRCIYELGERTHGLLRMSPGGLFELPAHRFMDEAFEAEDMDEVADMARQKRERKTRTPEDLSQADVECASRMALRINEHLTGRASADPKLVAKWALHVRAMRSLDGHPHREQEDLLAFALGEKFWMGVIVSPKLLRRHWNSLKAREASERAQDPKSQKKQLALDLGNTTQGELSL